MIRVLSSFVDANNYPLGMQNGRGLMATGESQGQKESSLETSEGELM